MPHEAFDALGRLIEILENDKRQESPPRRHRKVTFRRPLPRAPPVTGLFNQKAWSYRRNLPSFDLFSHPRFPNADFVSRKASPETLSPSETT